MIVWQQHQSHQRVMLPPKQNRLALIFEGEVGNPQPGASRHIVASSINISTPVDLSENVITIHRQIFSYVNLDLI